MATPKARPRRILDSARPAGTLKSMLRLSSKDKQLITELRQRFPQQVCLKVRRSADGDFVAAVADFPGVVTEGDTLSELIDMVNDAIWTYFGVPLKYRAFMPGYIPPLKMAQDLEAFPVRVKDAKVQMTRISRAAAPRTR